MIGGLLGPDDRPQDHRVAALPDAERRAILGAVHLDRHALRFVAPAAHDRVEVADGFLRNLRARRDAAVAGVERHVEDRVHFVRVARARRELIVTIETLCPALFAAPRSEATALGAISTPSPR